MSEKLHISSFSLRTPLRTFACIIGLACYWTIALNSPLFYRGSQQGDTQSFFLLFSFFLLIAIGAFIAVIYARGQVDRAFISSRLISSVGILLFPASYFFMHVYIRMYASAPFVNAIGITLYALGLVCATCIWGCTLYQFRQKESLLAVVISFMLSAVAFRIPTVFAQVDRMLVDNIMIIVMPVAWFFAFKPRRLLKPRTELSVIKDFPLPSLLVFLCCIYACAAASGILSLDDTFVDDSFGNYAVLLIPLIIATLMSVRICAERYSERFSVTIMISGTIIVLISLLLTFYLSSIDADSNIPKSLLDIARRFCMASMMLILVKKTHEKGISPSYAFSIYGIAAIVFPTLIGKFLVPAIDLGTNYNLVQYEGVALLIISSLLICVAFGIIGKLGILEIDKSTGLGANLRKQDAYDAIAQAHGLTSREQEVMQLIAEGNSMKKVAEKLFISLGTVQSHSKKIYRKLDIHDRQQLIDKVDKFI